MDDSRRCTATSKQSGQQVPVDDFCDGQPEETP